MGQSASNAAASPSAQRWRSCVTSPDSSVSSDSIGPLRRVALSHAQAAQIILRRLPEFRALSVAMMHACGHDIHMALAGCVFNRFQRPDYALAIQVAFR